jgi:hypothetical protein
MIFRFIQSIQSIKSLCFVLLFATTGRLRLPAARLCPQPDWHRCEAAFYIILYYYYIIYPSRLPAWLAGCHAAAFSVPSLLPAAWRFRSSVCVPTIHLSIAVRVQIMNQLHYNIYNKQINQQRSQYHATDPTLEQWAGISKAMKAKSIVPFMDCAYQGFASGTRIALPPLHAIGLIRSIVP